MKKNTFTNSSVLLHETLQIVVPVLFFIKFIDCYNSLHRIFIHASFEITLDLSPCIPYQTELHICFVHFTLTLKKNPFNIRRKKSFPTYAPFIRVSVYQFRE